MPKNFLAKLFGRAPPPAPLPPTMWDSLPNEWPPKAESVLVFGPYLMAAAVLPIAVHIIATLMEKPSKEELEADQQQAKLRIDVVNEMTGAITQEDLEGDKLGRVSVEALADRCNELLEAPRSDDQLQAISTAIKWLGGLVDKEVRIALEKTEAGDAPEYADGTKLDRLMDRIGEIESVMSRTGCWMEPAQRTKMWQGHKAARKYRRVMKRRGLLKALKLVLMAKSSLKWVVLQSCASVLVATVRATSAYYQASVLDVFATDGVSSEQRWEQFVVAATAMFYIEMLATVLGLLVSSLRARGQAKMGHELRLYFFGALLKKDLRFWTTKKGPWYEMISQVFHLDRETEEFLRVPETGLTILVTVATHATLVMQRSSSMLYTLLGINWGTLAVSYGFHYVQDRMRERATRGIIEPSMDEFTWVHALNPEYVATFQSFVRGYALSPAEPLDHPHDACA